MCHNEIDEHISSLLKSHSNVTTIFHQICEVFWLEGVVIEMEMLALKADVFLKVSSSEDDFWKIASSAKHCNIKTCEKCI